MKLRSRLTKGHCPSSFLVGVLFCAFACPISAAAQQAQTAAPSQAQKLFDTPQQAADALVQATEKYDVPTLMEIFGPDGKDFVSSGDPVRDKNYAEEFAAKAQEKLSVNIDPKNKARAIVSVGDDDWPFPVPIIKQGGKWRFDAKQGHDEILYRRIGT